MARQGTSLQKRQDALIALANARVRGVPVPTPGNGTLNFPTIAALAAYNVASPVALENGQQAFVKSNGSVWTLRTPDAADVADGITIVTATGAAAKWLRENVSGYLPAVLAQTEWFVDPQNATGTASDENDGKTNTTALLHKAEIYRRWGYTWAPKLVGLAVLIHYLSGDVPGSGATDPGLFEPQLISGATLRHMAASTPAAFTGTLLAVTAKNVGAAGNALKATFTTTTGAVAADMLLINTTRGNSRAVASSVSGATWTLSQPLAGPYASGFPSATNVDTWANGDAIQGFALMTVDLGRIGGQCVGISATLMPGHIVQGIHIVDSSAGVVPFPLDIDPLSFPMLVDCVVSREVRMRQTTPYTAGYFIGVSFHGFHSLTAAGSNLLGGILSVDPSGNPNFISSAFMGNNLLVTGATTFRNGKVSLMGNIAGTAQVYVDTGTVLTLDGDCTLDGAASAFYGPGTFNVEEGGFTYANSAATSLTVATLQLNGVATGYSLSGPASPKVISGGIALTSANLDAAAGVAGFGGFAWGGGAFISRSGVQP